GHSRHGLAFLDGDGDATKRPVRGTCLAVAEQEGVVARVEPIDGGKVRLHDGLRVDVALMHATCNLDCGQPGDRALDHPILHILQEMARAAAELLAELVAIDSVNPDLVPGAAGEEA